MCRREGLRETYKRARRLKARAERMEAEVLASERELSGGDWRVEGRVRLTAGDGLTTAVLAPRLLEVRMAHPALEVELRADNRSLDLSRREADVALRLYRPREVSLVARRLADVPFGLYASATYLDRRGRPAGLRDLARHDWLVYDASQQTNPPSVWLQPHVPGARVSLRANTTMALVSACAAGHGLALFLDVIAAQVPRLVPLRPPTALPVCELWAITHPDLRQRARIHAVLDWLAGVFPRAT